jgi:hypothetical protein
MFTARNTTALLGVIATGLMAIGAIAPAFAMSSHVSTNISAPVYQSNEQTSSPRTMAKLNTMQGNSPSSSIGAGLGKNSFGVGVANQNNNQNSNARIHQDVSITQDAHNVNLQTFSAQTTSTLFCIFDHKGHC